MLPETSNIQFISIYTYSLELLQSRLAFYVGFQAGPSTSLLRNRVKFGSYSSLVVLL